MQLDVSRSAALAATVQVMATMPREVAKMVRKYSKAVIQPEWKRGLAENAPPARIFHKRLVSPSAAYISDRGVRLRSGKAGAFPRETEFGAYREDFNEYTRRTRTGDRATVNRRTQRQFWHYTPKGHVVYPTARDLIPRIASLWVQTTYRSVIEAIEKVRG